MSDTAVHAIPGLSTAQDALDEATFQGQVYHDAGYMVGPPWYVPVPVRGTYPLEYGYEGRIWYGTTEKARTNRFYSHLHEYEEDAVAEAAAMQTELEEAGYVVGEMGVQTSIFDGPEYYQAVFYFSMPGVEAPGPFDENKGTPWYVWALPISLALTTVAVIAIKTKRN